MMIIPRRLFGRPLFMQRGGMFRRGLLRRALIVGVPAVAGMCLLASPLLAATTQRAAEEPARRAQGAERAQVMQQLRQVVQSLDLTDAQKQQVRSIFQQAANDIRSIRQDAGTTQPADKLSAVQARVAEARQQIEKVLTPEQLEKARPQLQAIRAEAKQRRQEMAGNFAKRLDAALAQLNLTPDQQQQISAIRADIKAKVQAVRDNPQDASARDALKAAVQADREQLQQILTREQKEQLKHLAGSDAMSPAEPAPATSAPASPKDN